MFNTLKYAKMLEEVGFSRKQAETSVRMLVDIMEDKLATKQDLHSTKLEIQAAHREIQNLSIKMDHSLKQLSSELTIRMGTMMGAAVILMTALIKLL